MPKVKQYALLPGRVVGEALERTPEEALFVRYPDYAALQRQLTEAEERENDKDRLIEQFCNDLQSAHNEILKLQGVSENKFNDYDWPEWSPQANSIRWAEELLGKEFSKKALSPEHEEEG